MSDSRDDPNLATVHAIHQKLRQSARTVCAAESMTGGRVQALLTSVAGASDVVTGGVTTYTVEAKSRILGIDFQYAKSCNAVSEKTACDMVSGACALFESTCGIATTGYAEPGSQSPSPFAWIAIQIDGDQTCHRIPVEGTRTQVQQLVAEQSLRVLLQSLTRMT